MLLVLSAGGLARVAPASASWRAVSPCAAQGGAERAGPEARTSGRVINITPSGGWGVARSHARASYGDPGAAIEASGATGAGPVHGVVTANEWGQRVEFQVRKFVTVVEEILSQAGIPADRPLRKVAAMVVVKNPYAGHYARDLSAAVAWSEELGLRLGQMAVDALGDQPESYGKAAIAGINGEQEHANAFLTTTFGDALRKAVGGGKAWITSNTKVGPPGTSLDVPLAYKDALYVRSHYDTMEVRIPDAPLPDEVVVIAVVANRGRLNARLGGLKKEEATGADGLR